MCHRLLLEVLIPLQGVSAYRESFLWECPQLITKIYGIRISEKLGDMKSMHFDPFIQLGEKD